MTIILEVIYCIVTISFLKIIVFRAIFLRLSVMKALSSKTSVNIYMYVAQEEGRTNNTYRGWITLINAV